MANLLVVLVLATAVCHASAHYHRAPDLNKLTTGVKVDSVDRSKRQSRQSLRIATVFDNSVDTALSSEKSNMLRDQTVPSIVQYFETALTVDRVQQALLFDRDCEGGTFYPTTSLGRRGCVNSCVPTVCGEVLIPDPHLRGCVQCNGGDSNSCLETSVDGAGVSNADIVLYISAIDTNCPAENAGGAQTVAFATACQMEASLDRPIAGNINFCPLGVTGNAADYVLELGIHEAMHSLAFASSLFAFWRDNSGNPRTPRDANGLPMNQDPVRGIYMPSVETIRSVTNPAWGTFHGAISHTVDQMVTPAVIREARAHFDCPTLEGVELENQGGSGTAYSHWEKRLLGNEGMTGELTFNPVFSRITLAAFEDSGWYGVDYSQAGDLAWGRNAGCGFLSGSCYDYIESRPLGGSVSPFCDDPPGTRGCTVDHQAVAQCDISTFTSSLPAEYQYFANPAQGGTVQIADFCPFYNVFSLLDNGVSRGTECSDPANAPSNNVLAQYYGQGSRCIRHGTRDWTNSRFFGFTVGSGCYQFSCSQDVPVTITVAGRDYPCSCEGEEIRFSFSDAGTQYTGSFICPSCAQLCYDTPDRCPLSETSCPGRVTNVDGTPSTNSPTNIVATTAGATPTKPLALVIIVAIAVALAF